MKNLLFLIFLFLLIESCLDTPDENYQPISLGANINTSDSEFAPFISADGTILFFSATDRKTNS